MGHIFISYSHKDTGYAHALANNLQGIGFEVWIDARLDYGSQWPQEIQKQLDSCDAFILIMTPRAFASEWVQSELQRAKRKLKPIFPMLLEGDEPWLSVESTQFYDVRGEKLPDAKFYSAIRHVVSVSQNDKTFQFVKNKVKPTPTSGSAKPKISTEILVAIIGAVVTLVASCATIIGAPLVQKWLDSSKIPAQSAALATNVPASTEAQTSPAEISNKPNILMTSECDPRTTPICKNYATQDPVNGFYSVINSMNGEITYNLPSSMSDLESYDLVIPYFCHLGDYNNNQLVTIVKQYIESGGSVVVMGSESMICSDKATSEWATEITKDFGITFATDRGYKGQGKPIVAHPLTDGVSNVYFDIYNYLNVSSPSDAIFAINEKPVIATYDGTGKVVVIADWGFELDLDSNEIGSSDHIILWKNIIQWLMDK